MSSHQILRVQPERLPPLFGAELRVDRAAEHIKEMKARLQAWADLHIEAFRPTLNPTTQEWEWEVVTPLPIMELGKASMVIGDALFNLRAALDYVVYTLALVGNNGKPVAGTQFPIDDDADMFVGHATGKHPKTGKGVAWYLRKVPDGAVGRIKGLQPFMGCKWTGQLRDLSNPDKHRELSALSSRGEWHGPDPTTSETEPGKFVVNTEGRYEVQVTLGRGGPDAADTLDLLEQKVRETIEYFKQGFQP